MLSKHRGGGEVVHRNVKEALNLCGMQIHAQDAVAAGAGDQVGHQFGGDRYAPFVLAILTGVAKVRNHRGNSPSAGAAQAIDIDQELHQTVIDWCRCAGNYIAVTTAHIFGKLDEQLTVGELHGLCLTKRQLNMVTHLLRKFAPAA